MDSIRSTAKLANGVEMPFLGLGVWQVGDGSEVVETIRTAVSAGYRSIDTAAIYGNESGVGQAIRECGIPRKDLFVTTKLWNDRHGYEPALAAFDESRKRLGLDYLDLYLIHWPSQGRIAETWRAFEKLYAEGLVRAIGVSNFQAHHLEDLLSSCAVRPMVDQVECHPLLVQKDLRAYCSARDIRVEAWSPLMQGQLGIPVLQEIAETHGKSPAQVVLRWDLQNGLVTIPKSVHPSRILENADLFDFQLSPKDIDRIDALDQHRRFGGDPDAFDR
jgi:methylglyoxal/glyoxal reductase